MSNTIAARVCVELDVSKTHPSRVWIGYPGGGAWQDVKYPKFPTFCSLCVKLGHNADACRVQSKSKQPADSMETNAIRAPSVAIIKPKTKWQPVTTKRDLIVLPYDAEIGQSTIELNPTAVLSLDPDIGIPATKLDATTSVETREGESLILSKDMDTALAPDSHLPTSALVQFANQSPDSSDAPDKDDTYLSGLPSFQNTGI